jgi:hypothetical protein
MKKEVWLAAAAALALSAGPARAQSVVTCESRGDAREVCAAGNVAGVSLRRQLSEADCIRGRTWGFTRTSIWVSRGCRAQFQVIQGDAGVGSGRYDRRGWSTRNAALACRRAVQSQLGRGVRVETSLANASRAHPRVNFITSTGRSGVCSVDEDGDLRVRVSRRNRNGNQRWN